MRTTTKKNPKRVQDTPFATSDGNDMPNHPFIFERHGKLLRIRKMDDALNQLLDAVDSLGEYTKAAARIYSAVLSSDTELESAYKYEFHLLQCMLELVQAVDAGME